jgi:tetratricopeptide (TPR) repeat protein
MGVLAPALLAGAFAASIGAQDPPASQAFPSTPQSPALSPQVAAYLERGERFVQQKMYQAALTEFRSAEKEAPDHWRVVWNIGNTLRNLQQYEDSIAYSSRAIAQLPATDTQRRYHANMSIAFSYRRLKNFEAAIEAYKAAASVQPRSWLVLWNLADLHYQTKQYELSVQYIEEFQRFIASENLGLYSDQERQNMRRARDELEMRLREIKGAK